jgi:hypothetical protein
MSRTTVTIRHFVLAAVVAIVVTGAAASSSDGAAGERAVLDGAQAVPRPVHGLDSAPSVVARTARQGRRCGV